MTTTAAPPAVDLDVDVDLVMDGDPEPPCLLHPQVATHLLIVPAATCSPHPMCLECTELLREFIAERWAAVPADPPRRWWCTPHAMSFVASVRTFEVVPIRGGES